MDQGKDWYLRLDEPENQEFMRTLGGVDAYRKFLLENVYVEPPVSMREFVLSPDYANYSDVMWPKVQTLLEEFDLPQYREAFLGVGRGGGKSAIGAIFLARSVYWLMNLRDPWQHFGLRTGTALTCLNVSVSGAQAQSVIFDNLVQIIEGSKYFKGKFTKRTAQGHADIHFPEKRVRAISGHSGSTVWRGYAIYAAVADEASWFVSKANKDNAEEIYTVLKGSMVTRFERAYKLLMISSLKSQDDFVCKSLNTLRKQKLERDRQMEYIEDLEKEHGIEDSQNKPGSYTGN